MVTVWRGEARRLVDPDHKLDLWAMECALRYVKKKTQLFERRTGSINTRSHTIQPLHPSISKLKHKLKSSGDSSQLYSSTLILNPETSISTSTMHFSTLLPALLSLATYASPICAEKAPSLKYAFTAHVSLGQPIGPVPVPGGETLSPFIQVALSTSRPFN